MLPSRERYRKRNTKYSSPSSRLIIMRSMSGLERDLCWFGRRYLKRLTEETGRNQARRRRRTPRCESTCCIVISSRTNSGRRGIFSEKRQGCANLRTGKCYTFRLSLLVVLSLVEKHPRLSSLYCQCTVHGSVPNVSWHLQNARAFHQSMATRHTGIERPIPGTGLKITFKDSKGHKIKTVEANDGDDILGIAHEYDIDLEGACEGSIACSTCHVILPEDVYDKLEEPGDDENDMLDMAFGLTDTSRLGCQVRVTPELAQGPEGMVVQLPSATRNMFVDGKKSTH